MIDSEICFGVITNDKILFFFSISNAKKLKNHRNSYFFASLKLTIDIVLVGFIAGHIPNDNVGVEARTYAVVAVGTHDQREDRSGVLSKRINGLDISCAASKSSSLKITLL